MTMLVHNTLTTHVFFEGLNKDHFEVQEVSEDGNSNIEGDEEAENILQQNSKIVRLSAL